MKYNCGQRDLRTVTKFANIVRRQDADCFSCADLQIEQILEQLKNTADINNTIILHRGDHGWDLRDARKHSLVKEPRHSLFTHKPDDICQFIDVLIILLYQIRLSINNQFKYTYNSKPYTYKIKATPEKHIFHRLKKYIWQKYDCSLESFLHK